MASGFTPPSDDRSRTTRGSEDSAPAAGSRDLVPAVSVIRTRTQSRPRAQAKAQAASDGTSTPSPQQQGVYLSAQQATFLAGASIQGAHQASETASAAASSALQGDQAAVLAQARQRFVESEANQVVDQVWSEARSFGHHVVSETQAEALRFRQELEHQAQEVLASATHAVAHAEARSRETEALAKQEARELQVQLSGARSALGESYDQTRMLQAQVQQLQDEKSQFAARLERIEALLASRTPVPSVATPRQPQASSSAHYPHMAFSPDQASLRLSKHIQHITPMRRPTEQPVERTAQPVRLQALFEGAASGAPELGREGSSTAQPVSSLPPGDDDWAEKFDLFGPGPGFPVATAPDGIVQDAVAQSPSVEERMNQLTSVVQELARLVTSGVATQSAQPLEGAAQGAPAASSSDALGAYWMLPKFPC